MKIGMILDAEFPPDPRVENEAISLVNSGFEVYLFCLSYNDSLDEDYKGIHICRYPTNKLIYKLSALAYTIPFYTNIMSKKIEDFIKKTSIDALHIHDIRIAEAAFKANEKYKLPTVLDLHDNMPEVMKFYPHLQKFPGKFIISPEKWKVKEAEFVGLAKKVITVSPEFINDLKNRFPKLSNKFSLVPNTIRSAFYEDFLLDESITAKYKDHFVMLYLGDTNIRRGLETPIRAIPLLKKEIPNIKLVIVGKNTTDYILKDLVIELGVEDHVNFEGWQDVSLFQSYIDVSNVCISPLFRNRQHDIAYANKLFQYMSFAKPLLVSDATAQKTLIQNIDGGLVHRERDENDFSQKLLELYRDENRRLELGKNGESFVKNEFNWEQTSKELITLYKNLSS